jgi:hypothetical protein
MKTSKTKKYSMMFASMLSTRRVLMELSWPKGSRA